MIMTMIMTIIKMCVLSILDHTMVVHILFKNTVLTFVNSPLSCTMNNYSIIQWVFIILSEHVQKLILTRLLSSFLFFQYQVDLITYTMNYNNNTNTNNNWKDKMVLALAFCSSSCFLSSSTHHLYKTFTSADIWPMITFTTSTSNSR